MIDINSTILESFSKINDFLQIKNTRKPEITARKEALRTIIKNPLMILALAGYRSKGEISLMPAYSLAGILGFKKTQEAAIFHETVHYAQEIYGQEPVIRTMEDMVWSTIINEGMAVFLTKQYYPGKKDIPTKKSRSNIFAKQRLFANSYSVGNYLMQKAYEKKGKTQIAKILFKNPLNPLKAGGAKNLKELNNFIIKRKNILAEYIINY